MKLKVSLNNKWSMMRKSLYSWNQFSNQGDELSVSDNKNLIFWLQLKNKMKNIQTKIKMLSKYSLIQSLIDQVRQFAK